MTRMNPQPPEGTTMVKQIGDTDSFDCLGLEKGSTNSGMLAVIHRPIGSSARPICEKGVWYWSNRTKVGVARKPRKDNADYIIT